MLLNNWKPRQMMAPVNELGKPLTATKLQNDLKEGQFNPFFANPEQEIDYLVYEDMYNYTIGGAIMRALTKFIIGSGFEPKIVVKGGDPSGKEDQEMAKKHKDITETLMAIDYNIGRSTRGLDIHFQEKISQVILNSLIFNRAAALFGFEEPVELEHFPDAQNIPCTLKPVHPRNLGAIHVDPDSWVMTAVQVRPAMTEGTWVGHDEMFYHWNPLVSAPAYQSAFYGVSLMRNMYDELRTLRRLISVNFPTYADATHTGIPILSIHPEGMTEEQRMIEGQAISAAWEPGGINILFKNPEQTRVDNVTFDPKIKEFADLANNLTKSAIQKAGLPQSMFFAENESNMATLRHRIQISRSVDIMPMRKWFLRSLADQWYQRWFDELYGGSQEHKDLAIEVEFKDIQIETMDDRIDAVAIMNNELVPLLPKAMGELLGVPNFENYIDWERFDEFQKLRMENMKQKTERDTTKGPDGNRLKQLRQTR